MRSANAASLNSAPGRSFTWRMRLPVSERTILELLAAKGRCYGLELVQASRGRLTRGGIYVTLGRMDLRLTSLTRGLAGSGRVAPWKKPMLA